MSLHDARVKLTTAPTAVAAQNATLTASIEELQQQLAAATTSAEAHAAEAAEAQAALEQQVTELKAIEVRCWKSSVLAGNVCISVYWLAGLPRLPYR
jgi:multidrug resistance efflux pump